MLTLGKADSGRRYNRGSLPNLPVAVAQGAPIRPLRVQEDGDLIQCFLINLLLVGRFLEPPEEAGDRRGCSPEQALRGLHPPPTPPLSPKEPPGHVQGSCLH